MSKRAGEFVTFEDLIDEVGVDAARFFFLMIAPETHLDFDLDLAKEKSQKNPVYYAQYAYVRALSILKKAKISAVKADLSLLSSREDIALLRTLATLPEIVEDIASDYGVQRLTRYARELARVFHDFYEKERIIPARNASPARSRYSVSGGHGDAGGGEEKKVAAARLALVQGTKQVFENLFKILGISAPQKM